MPHSIGYLATALLAATLAGCATQQAVAPAVPQPRDEPINSLAYEQCIRENPAEICRAG